MSRYGHGDTPCSLLLFCLSLCSCHPMGEALPDAAVREKHTLHPPPSSA